MNCLADEDGRRWQTVYFGEGVAVTLEARPSLFTAGSRAANAIGGSVTYVEVFFLLQILDFMTTLIGLRMGGSEMSPFISWLMQATDPVTGLTAVKVLGFGLAGFAVWSQRARLVRTVNYIFAGIVVWNLFNILRAVGIPG